jgi:mannan endo-1,4-beta-mannosidase
MNTFLQVKGSKLHDLNNLPITLRGVNKLFVFEHDPVKRQGVNIIPEIAKTSSNCIRVVWGMARKNIQGNIEATSVQELENIIIRCKANNIIAVVGLWDFTNEGNDFGLARLSELVDFWVRPDVVEMLKQHEDNLIINIANEAGTQGDDDDNNLNAFLPFFIAQYITAIQRIRATGLNVPLMIDGLDFGKSLRCFSFIRNGQAINTVSELLNADSIRNLIFSFHAYWPKRDTDGNSFVDNIFNQAIKDGYCFVIGELSRFGAWAGSEAESVCSENGEVDYARFVKLCFANRVGYMLWEWGPGNEFSEDKDGNTIIDKLCLKMNMTTDGTYASLKEWGLLIIGIYGFQMTSKAILRTIKGDKKKKVVGHDLTFSWNAFKNHNLDFSLFGVRFASSKPSRFDIPMLSFNNQFEILVVRFKTKSASEMFETNYFLKVEDTINKVTFDLPLERRD